MTVDTSPGALTEATWPPARRWPLGPFTVRDGQGGGKRVSAATVSGAFTGPDIEQAEHAMSELGQPKLFMILPGDATLDAALDKRGYAIIDPVIMYRMDTNDLAARSLPPISAFAHWPPLEITADIWRAAGIGPERQAVMTRPVGPKTAILARSDDRPSGVAFGAIHEKTAMFHAVEVIPALRRRKAAVNMMVRGARWAQDNRATEIAVLCVEANMGARALYEHLGFAPVGRYHYRQKTT
ncbi:MAG: GNAT family N-acetyltransferase [Pseudomonadota bacterium]